MKQAVLIVMMLLMVWLMYSCGDDTKANDFCYNETVMLTVPLNKDDLARVIRLALYHSNEFEWNEVGGKRLINPKDIILPAKPMVEVSVDEFENGKVYSFMIASVKVEESKLKIVFTPVMEFEVCK